MTQPSTLRLGPDDVAAVVRIEPRASQDSQSESFPTNRNCSTRIRSPRLESLQANLFRVVHPQSVQFCT